MDNGASKRCANRSALAKNNTKNWLQTEAGSTVRKVTVKPTLSKKHVNASAGLSEDL